MRLLVASVALASTLVTSTASAQQPPPAPYGPVAAPPGAAWWAPAPAPVTERRSRGMMITGIGFWAAGGVLTGVGAALTIVSVANPCVYYEEVAAPSRAGLALGERTGTARQALNGCDLSPKTSLGVLAAGVLTGIVGIPFFVVGNSPVRVDASPAARATPSLEVGTGSASLRWSF